MAVLVALMAASLAAFVAGGLVRRALGRGDHVLLEDVGLVLAAGAGIAHVTGQSPWRVLDVMAIAVGAFLVFGRLGCLAGGCCHGRPARLGVRYRADAVARVLVGIRLFPVQLVEAAWLLAVTLGSLAPLVTGPPGAAVWCGALAYCAGRFVLELARGDLDRPRLGRCRRHSGSRWRW